MAGCRIDLTCIVRNLSLFADVTIVQCVSKQPVGIVVCAVLLHLIELEDEENLTKRSWQCCGERFTTPSPTPLFRCLWYSFNLLLFCCSHSFILFHFFTPPFFYFPRFSCLSIWRSIYSFSLSPSFFDIQFSSQGTLLASLHSTLWRVGSQFLGSPVTPFPLVLVFLQELLELIWVPHSVAELCLVCWSDQEEVRR